MFRERFYVTYRIRGGRKEAYAKARDICFEQTVEFPESLVPPGIIREHIVGKIEEFAKSDAHSFDAVISFAVETAGGELPQLCNVLFGNISIKPGIRIEGLRLPGGLLRKFRGPRFGRKGMREYLRVPFRPLLCTALKPLGYSSEKLADLAYRCAVGGIDVVKDDHGLSDQCFAPFRRRVRLCARAVRKANRETGAGSIYVAHITAPAGKIIERARYAKEYGAGGFLISPGLTGPDTVRMIAEDSSLALPVFVHPAFWGTYVAGRESGIAHKVLFGQLSRLMGADAVIYPNFGGRFSFSREDCRDIVEGTVLTMGNLKPAFPCPGGGMSLHRVPEMLAMYGTEVIFLIGGGLFTPLDPEKPRPLGRGLTGHAHGPDLEENCRYFRGLVEGIKKY
jgi:ribulose-bisphosphate carboxylase large chain